MSPRMLTAPLTDRGMWRKLLARAHPDAGGAHELYIWTSALRDHVCSSCAQDPDYVTRRDQGGPPGSPTSPGFAARVPYEEAFGRAGSFAELTRQAVMFAESGAVGEPHASLLRLLADCYEAHDGTLYRQQMRGATYKQLAYIAHLAGMTPAERRAWYQIAERVPLSQRHAGHLVAQLQREAA